MASPVFILIVSAILNGHGFTVAARQDNHATCVANKIWYERELSHRGVRPLASRCQIQARFTQYVEEIPQPRMKPKVKKIKSKKRRFIQRKSCYMKYRYIHHHRHWYCSRRR